MSETGENRATPAEPLFFAKVSSRDYNIVTMPFRFKDDPTRNVNTFT